MAPAFTSAHRGGSGPPLLCLHGFTDTWRTWELVLPDLERYRSVLAPTLPGHAGGPPIEGPVHDDVMADAIERLLDEAGIETVDVVGNSLGGYVALQLAARGRARSVVALAPAGGWAEGDRSFLATLDHFVMMQDLLRTAVEHADTIASTPEGRRRATAYVCENGERIPSELVAHMIRGAARCAAVMPLIELARREGWTVRADRIGCPVRVIWGTEDRLLPWPSAAARFRSDWLPHADWVELDGIGHCPQLDAPLETAQLILGFSMR